MKSWFQTAEITCDKKLCMKVSMTKESQLIFFPDNGKRYASTICLMKVTNQNTDFSFTLHNQKRLISTKRNLPQQLKFIYVKKILTLNFIYYRRLSVLRSKNCRFSWYWNKCTGITLLSAMIFRNSYLFSLLSKSGLKLINHILRNQIRIVLKLLQT